MVESALASQEHATSGTPLLQAAKELGYMSDKRLLPELYFFCLKCIKLSRWLSMKI